MDIPKILIVDLRDIADEQNELIMLLLEQETNPKIIEAARRVAAKWQNASRNIDLFLEWKDHASNLAWIKSKISEWQRATEPGKGSE